VDDAELLSIPTEQLDIVITKKETKMGPSVENAQPIEIANESGINHSSGCYFRDNQMQTERGFPQPTWRSGI
jgi:hypothetical protein